MKLKQKIDSKLQQVLKYDPSYEIDFKKVGITALALGASIAGFIFLKKKKSK